MKKRGKIKQTLQEKLHDTELVETKHYSKKVAATVLGVFSVLSCVLAVLGFFYIRQKFSDLEQSLEAKRADRPFVPHSRNAEGSADVRGRSYRNEYSFLCFADGRCAHSFHFDVNARRRRTH